MRDWLVLNTRMRHSKVHLAIRSSLWTANFLPVSQREMDEIDSSTHTPPLTERLRAKSTNATFNAARLPRPASPPTAPTRPLDAGDGSIPAETLRALTDGQTLSDSEDEAEVKSPRNTTLTVYDELENIRERYVEQNEECNQESGAEGNDNAAEHVIQEEAGTLQSQTEAGSTVAEEEQQEDRTAILMSDHMNDRYTVAPLNVVHGSTGATNKKPGSITLNNKIGEGYVATPHTTGWGHGWNSTGKSSNAAKAIVDEHYSTSSCTPSQGSTVAAKSTSACGTASKPSDDLNTSAPRKAGAAVTKSIGDSSTAMKSNNIEYDNTLPRKDGSVRNNTDAASTTGNVSSAPPTSTIKFSSGKSKDDADGNRTDAPYKTSLDGFTETNLTGESKNTFKDKTAILTSTSSEKADNSSTTKIPKADHITAMERIEGNKPVEGNNTSAEQLEQSSAIPHEKTGKMPLKTKNTDLAEHVRQYTPTLVEKPVGVSSTLRSQTEEIGTVSKENTGKIPLDKGDGGLAKKLRARTLMSAKQDANPSIGQTDSASTTPKEKTGKTIADKRDNGAIEQTQKDFTFGINISTFAVNISTNQTVQNSIAWTKKNAQKSIAWIKNTANTAYTGAKSHFARTRVQWLSWISVIALFFIATGSFCVGAHYQALNGRLVGFKGSIVCNCLEQIPPFRHLTGTRTLQNLSNTTILDIPDPVFLNSPEADLTSLRYIITLMPATYISGRLALELSTKLETAEAALAYANEIGPITTTVYTTITIGTTPTLTPTTSASPPCDSIIYSLPLDLAILTSPSTCIVDAEICAVRELFISREAFQKELEFWKAGDNKGKSKKDEEDLALLLQRVDQWVTEWNQIVVRCLKGLVNRSLEDVVE